jgi:hypothetical protein
VLLARMAEKLSRLGVATVAVIATPPERARLYFRYRPPRIPVAADADLVTHRAYGLPNVELTPEVWGTVEGLMDGLVRQEGVKEAGPAGWAELDRREGFEWTDVDIADRVRHRVQLTGQFLIDRAGIVRWSNIEGAHDGLAGLEKFPTEEDILAAAAGLADGGR